MYSMSHKLIASLMTASLLMATNPALATPNHSSYELNTPGTTKTLHLPASAANASVISLGTAIDPQSGEVVEGYAFIHRKNSQAKGGSGGGGGSTCYAYLASGAKWKTVEPWAMNPVNTENLTEATIFASFAADILKWEDATDGVVNNSGGNILGTGTSVTDLLEADVSAPDDANEVYFGALDDPNTIAVTITWGIFGGAPANRKLVAWDMVFNEAYDWSASGEAAKMDFENIATHELGHAVGMSDLYTSSCVNETMYGYAAEGDTNKRTLNAGDLVGMNKLY